MKSDPVSPVFEKKYSPKGLQRLTRATTNSIQGWQQIWRDEAAFRQEVGLGVIFMVPAVTLPLHRYESLALLVSWLLVLIVEALNSAIEAAIDRIGYEHHELSGKAKDIGSLAVLMALVVAGLTWGLVVAPALLHMLD
ncbi:diacylglycerol kinase [Pseudomaricurvus hydrocarbonicus]